MSYQEFSGELDKPTEFTEFSGQLDSEVTDTGDEAARLAARYKAPERSASSLLPRPMDPLGLASGKPTGSAPIRAPEPAPQRAAPTPYRNKREALDDAVNLLEEGYDQAKVAESFGQAGIKFYEIAAHGKKRGSEYFKQQTAPTLDAETASLARRFPAPVTGEIKSTRNEENFPGADVALAGAKGAVSGFKMLMSATGAGGRATSTAEKALETADQYLEGLRSAAAVNDDERIGKIMDRAKDGTWSEQVVAAAKAAGVAPASLIAQGLGTSVPVILTSLLPGVRESTVARLTAQIGLGAAQGAGATKEAIFNAVRDDMLRAGVPKIEAEERAEAAQSYLGKNKDQIAIGMALGALASSTGVENVIPIGQVSKVLAKSGVSRAVAAAEQNVIGRGLIGGVTEGVPEFFQGSSEQVAQNVALQREGRDIDTFQGAVGSGTLEALAGAGAGSITSAAFGRPQTAGEQLARELDVSIAGTDFTSADPVARARLSPGSVDPTLINPTQTARGVADVGPSAPINFTPADSPSAQAGLAPIVVPVPTQQETTDVSATSLPPLATPGGSDLSSNQLAGGMDVSGPAVTDPAGAGVGSAGQLGVNVSQAGAVPGAAGKLATGLSRPFDRATDADLLARTEAAIAGQENNNADTQPAEQWFGRKGDGYTTQGDAEQALPRRQRMFKDLDWKVEPMANGKWRLAGYPATQETNNGNQAPQTIQGQAQRQQAPAIAGAATSTGTPARIQDGAAILRDPQAGGSVASQRIRDEFQQKLNAVNEPVTLNAPDPKTEAQVEAFGSALGNLFGFDRPIVAFDDPSAANGFAYDGQAFVNTANVELSVERTALHEFTHIVQVMAKADTQAGKTGTAAQEFNANLQGIFDEMSEQGKRHYVEAYLHRDDLANLSEPEREAKIQQILKSSLLRDEMTADFMGNRAKDRAFLMDLAAQDPSGFESFVNKWISLIDGLMQKLRGLSSQDVSAQAQVDKAVKDLAKAKMVARDALIAYRKGALKERNNAATAANKTATAQPADMMSVTPEAASQPGEPVATDYVDGLVQDMTLAEEALAAIKGINLFSNLGKLKLNKVDWTEIGVLPAFARGGAKAGSLEDRVADGAFDEYLPFNMRHDSATFDEQESTEYIKDALRGWSKGAVYYPYDVRMQMAQIEQDISRLQTEINQEFDREDINKEIQRIANELAQEGGVPVTGQKGAAGGAAQAQAGGAAQGLKAKSGRVYRDTRGTGVRFHGTSKALPSGGPTNDGVYSGSAKNIYGQGFYTSDAADIADGYTLKGKGGEPVAYSVQERDGVRLYDMEQPMTDEIRQIAKEALGDLYSDTNNETGAPIETLSQAFDEARAESKSEGYSVDEVQDRFDSVRYQMEGLGFRGFRHVGGKKTGRDAHDVRIYWFPEDDIVVSKTDLSQYEAQALTTYSPKEIEALEKASAKREADKKKADAAADQKDKADAEVGDFTLTGSDRAADVGAARGQGDIFMSKRSGKDTSAAEAVPAGQELIAIHNLTPENLLYADEIGGLPVPSIGVTKAATPFYAFGGITMIAPKGMVDPGTGTPVFDRDAYTSRFPELNYKKPARKAADAFYDKIKSARDFAEDGFVSQAFDKVVNSSSVKPDQLVSLFDRYSTPRALFARDVLGKTVKVPMRDVQTDFKWVNDKQFLTAAKPLMEKIKEMGANDIEGSAELKQLADMARKAVAAYVDKPGSEGARLAEALGRKDAMESLVTSWGVDGEWVTDESKQPSWKFSESVNKAMRNAGKKEVDQNKLDAAIDKLVSKDDPAYVAWYQSLIKPLFDQPTITVRGKQVAPTLDNIVEAMTAGGVAGAEKTMTSGVGKVSAMLGKRFKSLDEIKAARDQVVSTAQEGEGKTGTEKLLNDYRNKALEFFTEKDWRGNVDTWAGMDAAMEALAVAGKGALTDGNVRVALQRKGFRGVDQETIDLAKQGVEALRSAVTDYFEAKPQRAVALSEFRGAVVPKGVDPKALEVLAKNNIETVEYNPKKEGDREAKLQKLAKKLDKAEGDIMFSRRSELESGDPNPAEAQKIEAALTGKGVVDAAKWMAANAPDKDQRIIATAVAAQLSSMEKSGFDLQLNIAHVGDRVPAALLNGRGHTQYSSAENKTRHRIVVTLNGADVAGKVGARYQTVLHELVHAATIATIYAGEKKAANGTRIGEAVDRLYGVHNAIVAEMNKRITAYKNGDGNLSEFETKIGRSMVNAFDNPDETIAWALASREAQDWLNSIDYPSTGRSVWKELVEAVRSVLGLSPRINSALDEVLHVSKDLLEAEVSQSARIIRTYAWQTGIQSELDTVTRGEMDAEDTGINRSNRATIEVDGQDRPTTNSNGQQIASTEDGVRNFWRWFGDSKVVDAQGKPLVVYHGTKGDFSTFDIDRLGSGMGNTGFLGAGFYFTNNDFMASGYSGGRGRIGEGSNVMPVYLSLKNPLNISGETYRNDSLPRNVIAAINAAMPREAGLDAFARNTTADGFQGEFSMAVERNSDVAQKFSDNLQKAGYDGVMYDGGYEIVAFRPEQIKSATGNSGEFDPADPDIRFSNRSIPRQKLIGSNFEVPATSNIDAARIKLQDDGLRMKRVIEAVKAKGGTVGEAQNFYDANTLMPGRIQAAIDDFKNDVVRPMLDKAAEFGIDMDELSVYAYAKHAKERNAYIASINPRLPDGGSGMTNADADAVIAKAKAEGKEAQFEELHQALMGITSATRQVMLSEGLITPDEFTTLEGAYDNYIPLRGFENVDEETGVARPGVGRGVNVRGAETVRAMGRKSRAGDLIENVIRDYERVVARVEKNDVAKVLLDFVLSNPDPDLWGVDVERSKPSFNKAQGTVQYTKSIEKGEDTIGVKVGGQQVYIKFADKELTRALRQAWKDETSGLERATLAMTGWWNNWLRAVLTKYNPAFALINIPRDALWSGTASALAELGPKGLAKYLAAYPKALMASTRQEAGVAGTSNKLFGNPVMDARFKEFRSAGGITGGFFMRTLDDINQELRNELLLAGASARTPWEKVNTLPPFKLAKMTLKMLEFMGAASENATRFALYQASREVGNSPAKAAILAKDGTTNFNRKGEWGGALNNLYLFFNAGVQGNAQLFKVVLKSPAVQASMAGVAGIGMMLALYGASAGGEDDDGEAYWDKIPSYIKERNMVIMLPPGDALAGGIKRAGKRGRYVTIPVQYGFNIFPNLGYTMADVLRNQADPKRGMTPTKAALHMTSTVFGSVNPFGGAVDLSDGVQVLLAAMPTLADLPIQIVNERNTFGSASSPFKSPWDVRPDSERMFTSQQDSVSAKIAKALNELGGGNEGKAGSILGMDTSVAPGTIQTLISATTGGLGTFVEQVGTAVMAMTGDDKDLKANKIPFLNKFYGEVDEGANTQTARERMDKIKKLAGEVKAQQKLGLDPELSGDDERLLSLARMQETYQRQSSMIRKAELDIIKDEKMTKPEKALERQRLQVERDKLATDMNREYLRVVPK